MGSIKRASKKRGYGAFAKLLELRSPPLVDELRLHLANTDEVWKDPEALAKKHAVGMPYWAVAWAGGTVLARYVLDHPEQFVRRNVVDFGSGSGIAALAAARVGARSVTAVEIDPVAADAIAANARANGLHVNIDVGDWLQLRHRVADIVLAGDTCYDKEEAKPILKWLRSQAAVGADVLLGDSHRPHAPRRDVAIVFEMSYITTRQTDDDTLSRARVMRLSATAG